MKDTRCLYSISILAIIGVLICLIVYATYTRARHKPETISASTNMTETLTNYLRIARVPFFCKEGVLVV